MARSILLIAVVLLSASPCRAQVPKLFREKPITCKILAEAANHYIALGEKAALKELDSLTLDWDTDHNGGFSRNERIGWLCRILFQPRDKEPLRGPAYGGHDLPRHTMPSTSWPLYPVACSGSSYFVLSEGYSLDGKPEDPRAYLSYCQTKGKFRTERVQVPSRLQALKDLEKLRQSAAWKAIKWTDSGQGFSYTMSEDWTWGFIRAQAKKTPEK
jgi:hypothetical protein